MAERRPLPPSTSLRPLPGPAASPLDELQSLIEREARMAEREQAMLARRSAASPDAAAESDAAVEWSEALRARERALALRGEVLLAWGVALDRATPAPIPAAGQEAFWDSLSERLGVVLAHELPELGTTDVTDVVARALTAVGAKPRSRPPSALPPALPPEPVPPTRPTAIAEEAELLAGVGGAQNDDGAPEEAPSLVSFMRALDDALPGDGSVGGRTPEAPGGTPSPAGETPHRPPSPAPLPEGALPPPPEPAAAPPQPSAPTPDEAPPRPDPLAAWPAFDETDFGELDTPAPAGSLPAAPEDAFSAWGDEAVSSPAVEIGPSVPGLDDAEAALMASILAEVDAVEAAPAEALPFVDEFASFAALSEELNSAIEQTVEAVAQSAPRPEVFEAAGPKPPVDDGRSSEAPAGGLAEDPFAELVAPVRADLSVADREMALRMTEEVHLTDDDIAGIFAGGRPGREAFAFELAAAPAEPPAPEMAPPGRPATVAPVAPEPASDDPFADLAAELEDFEPGLAASADDHDLLLEPIPGYDLSVPAPTPPPPAVAAPLPARPPEPPRAAPVAPEPAPVFRPSLGRVDRASSPSTPAPRPARTSDRSAATFAALAAELDVGGVDPWRELDISDLRVAGHPGPLPTPAPQTRPAALPERMRGQRGHRANLAVKVGVEYGTTFFTGFSGNVSKGGVFVATHQTLPLGARVELFFEMPDGHAVSVPATVRWGRDVEQAALDGSPPGLGFSFVSLTHDDAIILERYIAAHAQSVLYDEANPPGRA